ncbi:filamentous hemagglutinin N-terminal domain-containing protein [Candidatus Albibeggiatoa sp. nov. NOAA]|uniref:two-partner secretion domain-containing protein n=1 Tax=Candidatus Albibeggiatoa sp. nov. NOAA TaxID=3162724 RepID=UPI0033030578|nr:filamentous hemagglutinin N-terminal domain-containing protein [Thiotrichaceae bacterium]
MKVIIMFLLIFPVSSYAEIILHGTKQAISLGTSSTYDLHQHLGQTIGSNLFHTFDSFNLNQGETAHFSGANSIQNIVARVIGGEASFIDGALKSSIPNADLYFLNPYGIMLGANARLDLQGGLHLSTADYVRLGDEGEFHARFPERDILTTASISSFGFLTDSPAPISITGKEVSQDFGEKYEDDYTKAPLQLREQQPFSLIGGEINISSDYYYESDENRQNNIKTPMPFMHIPQGQVGFIATNAVGEISINNIEELLNTNQFADISLSDTKIKNSGGGVFVYGNNVTLTNSELHPWIDGNIEVRGNTSIFAADIFFDSVLIESSARNVNDAGNITLDSAGGITLQGSSLYADSGYQVENGLGGNAGKIKLGAQQGIQLTNSEISSTSYGAGDADNITLDSAGDITLQESILYSNSEYETENDLGGNAGNILLKSIGEITLLDTRISSTTWNNGNAGEIKLDAQKGIGLTNSQVYSITERTGNAGNITLDSIGDITLQSSLVSSNSQYETENDLGGNAGNILLKSTGKITLLGTQETKSEISSSTWNNGDAGNIILDTVGDIMLQDSNLYSDSNSQYETASDLGGNAGNILLKSTGKITLLGIQELLGTQEANSITSDTLNNGNAGEIKLDAQQGIEITNLRISNIAYSTGDAGDIILDSIGDITLQSSNLHSDSQYTTASDLGGNAGSILLKNTGKITLLSSQITSQTLNAGNAGEIKLNAQQGIELTNSTINTITHRTGNAGNITLDSVGDITLQSSNLYSNSQYQTESGLGGNAGNILLKSIGKITLLGTQEISEISSITWNNGDAGNIILDAQQGIELTNSTIFNTTVRTGNAGNITLDTTGDITLQSSNLHSDSQYTTASDLGGNAGNILLKSIGEITLLGTQETESTISSTTWNNGNAGNITLDSVGDITLQISTLYSNSQSKAESGLGGNAGNMYLTSQTGQIILKNALNLEDYTGVSSSTWNNGQAGNITLTAARMIGLFDKVEVTTSAEAQEQVDGGKINLKSNFIVTTGESIVDSTAKLGDGGVININAISTFDYNQRPINKVFDITSEQGIDGEIQIDTIDSLNSEALENLPSELIVTDLNFELSCLNQDTSSFRLIPRSGIATRAHDWQSAH